MTRLLAAVLIVSSVVAPVDANRSGRYEVTAMTLGGPRQAQPAFNFNPGKMREGSDSYDVFVVQPGGPGQARMGSQHVSVAKEGTNYRLISRMTAVAMEFELTSAAVVSGETLTGISATVIGSQSGQPIDYSLSVTDGRLTGTLQDPDSERSRIKTVKVDTPVPAFFLLDEEELIAFLPTVDLADGMKAEFPELNESTGGLRTLRVSVSKQESVTVPAGKFDAFRVRVQGSGTNTYYVTATDPKRVVKVVYREGIELRLK